MAYANCAGHLLDIVGNGATQFRSAICDVVPRRYLFAHKFLDHHFHEFEFRLMPKPIATRGQMRWTKGVDSRYTRRRPANSVKYFVHRDQIFH